MSNLYRSPLRVYLALVVLSLIGIVSAVQLPISLFPNSSKPKISLCVGTNLAPETFLRNYGETIENQLKAIRRGPMAVEKVSARYRPKRSCFETEFNWGGDPDEALREMRNVAANIRGFLPEESRDQINVYGRGNSGGFLALSFYSEQRSLTELFAILEPVIVPKLSSVHDAQDPQLYNPQKNQVLVELRPEALASFELLPAQIARAIEQALESYGGGSLTQASGNLVLDFPRSVHSLDDLKQLQIPTGSGRSVSLGDLAHIDLSVPLDSTQVFKTSGTSSLILVASPKPGGNVKSMAEEIKAIVETSLKTLPKDIQYRIIVDPSEFIRSAVGNVGKEVAIAAGLAVFVLFLFVGNIKNVATAAIEIPLSLVLAFILMRMSNMNLNLISLGGLALSAGMNVDASVVVMENIFRHFEERRGETLSYEERFQLIAKAVKEVQFSVIASTIASLVVFLPLAFTSDLTYAILGDLAKAVVFSHGFSAIVALILVPTIRLHLMKDGMAHEKPSILEGPLQKLETAYANALGRYLTMPVVRRSVAAAIVALLIVLVTIVAPRLPREIIGKPDTDWIDVNLNTSGNTMIRQMEAQTDLVEQDLVQALGDRVLYTFTEVYRADSATVMLRLRNKKEMEKTLAELSEKFSNTPDITYEFEPWNPAELPLPEPPDYLVSVRGTNLESMAETTRDLVTQFQEQKIFARVSSDPFLGKEESLRLRPRMDQWMLLSAENRGFSVSGLADLTRTATAGQRVAEFDLKGEKMGIFMRFPENYASTPEELGALPIGVGSRILPLKALASISLEPSSPPILRENGREAFLVKANANPGDKAGLKESIAKANEFIKNWSKRPANLQAEASAQPSSNALAAATTAKAAPILQIEDSQMELNSALRQLVIAVSLSVALIFLTMVFQFGSIMNSLLVLVAVPLGFIGVLISLFVFQSTLSLNSMLGVILLNGLAVANSIILVDFLQRKVKEGMAPHLAAVEVARVRLRPILMTSLTTGLGMLPIALGFGEGGKILQPLGIAVAGGLGFSMVTTLFLVPSLQVSWLEWRAKRGVEVHHA